MKDSATDYTDFMEQPGWLIREIHVTRGFLSEPAPEMPPGRPGLVSLGKLKGHYPSVFDLRTGLFE